MTALEESGRLEDERTQTLALAVRAAVWAEDQNFKKLFPDSSGG